MRKQTMGSGVEGWGTSRAELRRAPDCLQRPVRRSSACNIPIVDGKDAEEIRGSAADLSPQGQGDKRLPTQPRAERRRGNRGAARPACQGARGMACSPRPIGPWRASGASVSPPGGRVAPTSGRPGRPRRVQHRPLRAGTACVDRLPHARTWCRSARREGRRGESPRGTALPEESADGKAVHRGWTPPGPG